MVMVFLFMIPAIPGVFGNFVLPLMLGAKDVAFPRLNLLSLYVYWTGAALALWGMINGGADTGWTFYTPYSTTTPMTLSPVLLGRLHHRVLVHPHRPQLHRHRAHAAGAGHHLDEDAAVRVGASTPPASSRCWPRRSSASSRCWWASKHVGGFGLFDPGARRRSGAVPAPVLVLLAPGRVHHGAARHGRHERGHRAPSAARTSSATR